MINNSFKLLNKKQKIYFFLVLILAIFSSYLEILGLSIIPFYVAAPISSIDFSIKNGLEEIPIEIRNEDEISYSFGINDKGKIEK